jgi:hypothetical protein
MKEGDSLYTGATNAAEKRNINPKKFRKKFKEIKDAIQKKVDDIGRAAAIAYSTIGKMSKKEIEK